MSAAQAGQGTGGDAGQAQGGEAAPAFDASALQQQLQATAGGVDELRQQFGQFLQSAPWQQQAEPEADPGIDLSFLDQGLYDPAVGEAERDQYGQQLASQFDQRAEQRVQQAVAPLQEQLQNFQREQQIRDLISAHPEFQDPEIAQRIAGPDGLARQWADAMGTPEHAQNPQFWRLVLMAERAAQAANAEEGAQAPNAATLEGGGGSGPAASQQDAAQQRVDALFGGDGRKGSSVLPFG
jgi:hypothetical protein